MGSWQQGLGNVLVNLCGSVADYRNGQTRILEGGQPSSVWCVVGGEALYLRMLRSNLSFEVANTPLPLSRLSEFDVIILEQHLASPELLAGAEVIQSIAAFHMRKRALLVVQRRS